MEKLDINISYDSKNVVDSSTKEEIEKAWRPGGTSSSPDFKVRPLSDREGATPLRNSRLGSLHLLGRRLRESGSSLHRF